MNSIHGEQFWRMWLGSKIGWLKPLEQPNSLYLDHFLGAVRLIYQLQNPNLPVQDPCGE